MHVMSLASFLPSSTSCIFADVGVHVLSRQRKNEMDNTYYFDKKHELKTCKNEVRTALLEMCAEAEKIPGISVDHWPWQGHSLNLNKRGFR